MAHFAKLNQDNIVLSVHTVNNDVITVDDIESEQLGIDFLTNLHNHSYWKQTSYNGNIRKNYAGIGFIYDEKRDAFIAPKPYDKWILNEETCRWEAPIPYPTDGLRYVWNDNKGEWEESNDTTNN